MSKYELKVDLDSINIETWKQILEELRQVGEATYIIDLNESNTFSWFYKGDFISAVHAVQKSSHYDILDEYVLFNINTKNIVSGDGEYIIDRLEKNKKKYISTLLSYLNNGTIFYSYWMRPIIEEC
jgi:hypothetical protein